MHEAYKANLPRLCSQAAKDPGMQKSIHYHSFSARKHFINLLK